MQLKVTSVPRSTISTSSTEAAEGGGDGRGSDLFSNKQCSYHQLLHEINRGWTLQGWHHEPTTPFWPSNWMLARPGPPPPPPDSVCHVALTHNIESSLHRCGGSSVGGTAGVQTPVHCSSHWYGNSADIEAPTECRSRVRLSDWPRPHHRGGSRAVDSAGQDGLLADAHHRSIQLRDNLWVHWKRGMEGGREGGREGN